MFNRRFWPVALMFCIALVAVGSQPALAKKYEYYGSRIEIDLGAFWANASTDIRLDSAVLGGTTFSFENDLGLEDNKVVPQFGFRWRPSRRSSILLDSFQLNRSGVATARIDITIPDPRDPSQSITIGRDVEVDSLMNTQVTFLAYGFSILNRERSEFGVRFGLHITSIEVGLAVPSNPSQPATDESVTAPLPTFGLFGGFMVGKRIRMTGDLGIFKLEIGDFEGTITDVTFGFRYELTKLIGLGASLQAFQIKVEASTEDFGGVGGLFDYRYVGPAAFLTISL